MRTCSSSGRGSRGCGRDRPRGGSAPARVASALFSARIDPRAAPGSASRSSSRVDPARLHFFDPDSGATLLPDDATRPRPRRDGLGGAVTKQRETRDQVFDLIDRLGVGEAIPSERQLSADLGVSRLTVRAALDDLAREGYLDPPPRLGHLRERAEESPRS